RIDPTDRAIFDVDAPRMAQPTVTPPLRAAPVAATPGGPAGGVSRDHINRLHAALHELVECRKLIDGALAPEK
ncbi:MAG: hypothetical protein Q8K85_22395, partial [Hyphomicrobium sp.]|nr:hypothetical protein [Hyphomicrobium sp.]